MRNAGAGEDHGNGSGQAEGEAQPAETADLFADHPGGDQADEDGLQADDDRHPGGRDARLEGDVAEAEIGDLDQEAGDGNMPGGAAVGELRLEDRDQRQEDEDRDDITQRQQGERPGMQEADLGDGEAG